MTATTPAAGTPVRSSRRSTWRWVAAALVSVIILAVLTSWFTASRPGGRMDPDATGSEGAHALVQLLRDQGVDVHIAHSAGEAAELAKPGTLTLVAQTYYVWDPDLLKTLATASGDLLLVEPASWTLNVLAPQLRSTAYTEFGTEPGCDLRAAQQAGTVRLGAANTYEAKPDSVELTSCYNGALVSYRDHDRAVTVVGSADFMTNSGLLREGNAALAMNLAGASPRLTWYAPQEAEGQAGGSAGITDLIPDRFNWITWQLILAVLLLALWRARRLGPLVSEQLPVVVRASETVEGRGRMYRARRSRDRAAQALRTAAIQRLTPRLGLGGQADPSAVVSAVVGTGRTGFDPVAIQHILFGPPPTNDDELVQLAHALDDIERKVTHS